MSLAAWSSLRTWFSRSASVPRPGRGAPRRLRLEALEERTLLSAGDLDTTFGNGGLVTTRFFPGSNARSSSVAVQADGRIVVVGFTGTGFDGFPRSVLTRYDRDGRLDGSFGTGGWVTPSFGGTNESASGVAVLADGRIVVAASTSARGISRFALARYDSAGRLDSSFGNSGEATTSFPGYTFAAASGGMAVQSDDRLVLAGYVYINYTSRFALARYDSDGTLDSSFGSAGLVTTPFPGFSDAVVNSVAVQADGHIVVVGNTSNGTNNYRFAMARYNSDGSLDDSFGNSGLVSTSFPGFSNAGGSSEAVQADGSIVVAGYTSNGTSETGKFALARYASDGSLDDSFGNSGLVTTDFGDLSSSANGVAVRADGRIVVVGVARDLSSAGRFGLARYDPDGRLDSAFGTGGLVTTSFPGSLGSSASAVAVQADGRLVVAGQAFLMQGWFAAVARYEGDAIAATHFDVSAPGTMTAGQSFDVTVTALDDNGNVVPDYTGTVTLTSTDPQVPTLGSHTFTAADHGVFTYTGVQQVTAGPQSVFADDGDISGQADLTVDPGLAVALVLSGPDQAAAGVPFVVTLTAYDAYGNIDTGYRGLVSFVSTDPAAQLPVDYAFTSDDAGSHDFTITLNSPGPVRLTAIDTYALTLSYLDLTVN